MTKRAESNEKVALTNEHQYFGDIEKGPKWRLTVRPYLASRAPEADEIFKLIESHDDVPATVQNLSAHAATGALAAHYTSDQLKSLASDLSGFLILNLQGIARLFVDNSIPQEGFELWQKVVRGIRSRGEIRRHELLSQVQRPPTASKLTEVPMAWL